MASKARQLQSFYDRLAMYVGKDKASKAVIVCDKIAKAEEDPAKLKRVLKTKVACLIQQGKVEEAFALATEQGFAYEQAYCLYKNKASQQALDVLEKAPNADPGVRNLKAQLLYRLGEYSQACELYQELVLAAGKGVSAELLANYAAACALAGQSDRALELLADHGDKLEQGANYDLVYNKACALLAIGETGTAVATLDRALALGTSYLEADDVLSPKELANELAAISVQRAFALQSDDVVRAASEDEIRLKYLEAIRDCEAGEPAAAVAANNLLAMRGDHELFDSYKAMRHAATPEALDKLPPSYARAVWFNKALLLLKMQKAVECRQLLAELAERFPSSEKPVLIEAALLLREKKVDKCADLLRSKISAAGSDAEAGAAFVLALAQIEIGKGELSAAIDTLRGAEKAVRLSPKVVAAVVALCEASGDADAAQDFLGQVAAEASQGEVAVRIAMVNGAFLQKRGRFQEAAGVFEAVVSGKMGPVQAPLRMDALASFVMASSHVDLAASEAKATALPLPPAVHQVDVSALETGLALKARRVRAPPTPSVRSGAGDQSSSSRAQGLSAKVSPSGSIDMAAIKAKVKVTKAKKAAKRREKRREAYLAELKMRHGEDFDPSKHLPDPERWIPVTLRAKARKARTKRGGKLTGAQGVGDVVGREAARLDAHAQDVAASSAPAAGSSSGPKGKRKGRR